MNYQQEIEKIDIKIKDRERQIRELLLTFADAYWQVWKFKNSKKKSNPLLINMIEDNTDISKYKDDLTALETEIEKFNRDKKVLQTFLKNVNQ